eukprot:359359-Chlamydomonas_euryale.AAC.7
MHVCKTVWPAHRSSCCTFAAAAIPTTHRLKDKTGLTECDDAPRSRSAAAPKRNRAYPETRSGGRTCTCGASEPGPQIGASGRPHRTAGASALRCESWTAPSARARARACCAAHTLQLTSARHQDAPSQKDAWAS